MTATSDTPLTAAEVMAILADARTWPRCLDCNGLHLDTCTHSVAPFVDTDLDAIDAPHRREAVAAFLDRTPAVPLGLHRFRVPCKSDVQALSVASLLQHLAATAGAITIGGGSK